MSSVVKPLCGIVILPATSMYALDVVLVLLVELVEDVLLEEVDGV